MLITQNIQELDLTKYDRFIAIGCSFTNYRWSTWADLLSLEMPQAEYINLGRSGAGNQYIAIQLNQVINSLELTERDFVAIMWSGFYREDKYISGHHQNWCTPGNIFSQDTYSEQYINDYADLRGYTVRDLATIDMVTRILDNEKFHAVQMMGIPYQLQSYHSGVNLDTDLEDLFTAYNWLEQKMLPDLAYYINPEKWTNEYSYLDNEGNEFSDYHPSVEKYAGYLEYLGFRLSDSTKSIVAKEHEWMNNVKTVNELKDGSPKEVFF